MRVSPQFLLIVAFATATLSASAETRTAVPNDPGRSERVSAAQGALIARKVVSKSTEAVNTATPGLPVLNPVRAYPPSCLADPLPDQTSGPTYSTTANLAAYNRNTGEFLVEGVTITVWRVACSSSEFFTSATLMRIKRQTQFEGDSAIYPLFPAIRISQGSTDYTFDPNGGNLIRVAEEPNTVLSDTFVDVPIIFSTTYVLENYPFQGAGFFDFNLPFGLQFDNLNTSNNLFYINAPLYNPNSSTYPAAFQNLPISGYMSTNYFDPTADGEGIVLQVYEVGSDPQNLTVSFTWVAYDPSGVPFWLAGQVTIPRGTKTANAPMFYRTGGGFGGNAGGSSAPISWGSATVSFPDCNRMNLSYASNPGLPAGVPSGTGSRVWQRIANVNALACE